MTKYWRRVHQLCTVFVGLFILLASVTGIVLAIEPLVLSKNSVSGAITEDLTYVQFVDQLQDQFIEIFSIEIDPYQNIKVQGISESNDDIVYINAQTLKAVVPPQQFNDIFQFSRDLHRSLFLKTPGRILMGLAALGLLILVISGIGLQIRRAGGLNNIFTQFKIIDPIRDGHSVLSKLFVLPIIIIALSGVYLSIYRFFPPNPSKVTSTQVISTSDILALKLKDIVKVSFALDEEESTIIQLGDKTIFVSYDEKSFTVKPNQWSTNFQKINFILHTGEGTVYWSLILLTTSIVILILCLSGFAMVYALTKKKKIITSPSEFNGHKVILVGSEMGSTWRFAYALKKAFETKGEKIAIFGLDQMPFLSGEKQLFILTSTYGDGDPPENAKKAFANITCKLTLADKVQFAVLGFGSREYPEFCAFAEKLRDTMCLLPNTTEILPYSTVDRQSIFQFLGWIKLVNSTLYYDLTIPVEELQPVKRKNLDTFTIIEKKQVGETFTLTLSHQCFIWINSGDLIAVYPPDENVERYYSIAVLGKNKFLLVIKKTGKCSNYLGNLQVGDNFFGFIKQNLHFHLPQEFSRSLLIANGTGIAPFLGMMQNDNTTLYWGGRYHEDYDLFKEYLQNYTVQTIFSKETPIGYVQNLMAENPSAIIDLVKANGIIMICGSLTMLKGVLEILDQILSTNGLPNIIVLKSKKQILIDCY